MSVLTLEVFLISSASAQDALLTFMIFFGILWQLFDDYFRKDLMRSKIIHEDIYLWEYRKFF